MSGEQRAAVSLMPWKPLPQSGLHQARATPRPSPEKLPLVFASVRTPAKGKLRRSGSNNTRTIAKLVPISGQRAGSDVRTRHGYLNNDMLCYGLYALLSLCGPPGNLTLSRCDITTRSGDW